MLSEQIKYTPAVAASKIVDQEQGFSLVELMIALILTGIVTIGLYRTYVSFQVTFEAQDQLVELQQNLRIGMNRLASDLKMAGYDPKDTGDAGIKNDAYAVTNNTRIQFKMDFFGGHQDGIDNDTDGTIDEDDESVFGDGDFVDDGEHLLYFVEEDSNGDNTLYRQECTLKAGPVFACKTKEPIVSNVEKLEFVYLAADGTKVTDFADTRTVQVALIMRTSNEDFSYTHTDSYTNLFGETIFSARNDNFHRRVIKAAVHLRN